jgi:hypothetical protein
MSINPGIAAELAPLFDEARRTGMWFFHGGPSGPLWFSPDHLVELQARGSYRWDAKCWVLRNPREWLADAERRLKLAQEEVQRVKAELKRAGIRHIGPAPDSADRLLLNSHAQVHRGSPHTDDVGYSLGGGQPVP